MAQNPPTPQPGRQGERGVVTDAIASRAAGVAGGLAADGLKAAAKAAGKALGGKKTK